MNRTKLGFLTALALGLGVTGIGVAPATAAETSAPVVTSVAPASLGQDRAVYEARDRDKKRNKDDDKREEKKRHSDGKDRDGKDRDGKDRDGKDRDRDDDDRCIGLVVICLG
jgi:hypothetical protein